MKALVIILAVVAISFLALLVYGSSRSEQPGTAQDCSTPRGFTSNSEPDEDDLEDFCPPGIAEDTRPLQARFAPDLDIEPVRLASSSLGDASFSVGPSDKKMRAARIELVQGGYAILRAGDNKLCLCRAGPMADALFEGGCPDRWKQAHLAPKAARPRVCGEDETRGILPIGMEGGTIRLLNGPEATVTIE